MVESRKHGNESAAIGALKTIGSAQSLFRDMDKDNDKVLDYGTLTELGDQGLVDFILGEKGEKLGYRFEVRPNPTTPEFLFMATANPIRPTETGDRYFAINHQGVTFYTTTKPFDFNAKSEIRGGVPVGR